MRTKHFIGLKGLVLTLFTGLWISTGLFAQNDPAVFITTWDTTKPGTVDNNSITLPLTGTYDVDVGNDGTYELTDQTGTTTIDVTQYGLTAGEIQLAIRNAASGGTLTRIEFPFNSTDDRERLVSVDRWGTSITWSSMQNAFNGCINMDVKAPDTPNLEGVTNMSYMFYKCGELKVTDNSAADFNTWNTANVTNMIGVFREATAFNQDVGSWNTSSVTNMTRMFNKATVFDQNIGSWNTSKVAIMEGMFLDATIFNGDISSWNVAMVTNMRFMFTNAIAFNKNIGSWDVSKVTTMNFIFENRPGESGYNGKTPFNQNLGQWNLGKLEYADDMFENSGISPSNWDATIEGWQSQNFTNSVTIDAVGLQYCDADMRNQLNSGSFKVANDTQNTAPPMPLCKDVELELDANGQASITTSDVDNGSYDACSTVSLSLGASQTSFTGADVGGNAITVTLTVTDDNDANSTSTCTTDVTVLDNTPPNAICQNTTVTLDGTGNGTADSANVNNNSTDNSTLTGGTLTFSLDEDTFTCSDVGDNPVTLTVTDKGGNTDTCTATVTVQDVTNPTPQCQDVTLQLDANGEATLTTDLVNNNSSDACGIASLSLGVSKTNYTGSDLGEHTVTLTVTDNNSRPSTCESKVTVVDNMAPTAKCNEKTTVILSIVDGTATITTGLINDGSTDNVDGNLVELSLDKNSFSCSDVGQLTVTLTATDSSSNEADCTTEVTVQDFVFPEAVCGETTIELDANGTATLDDASLLDGGSSDACGTIESYSASPDSFTAVGTYSVTLTVIDNSGNQDNCTATVIVEDKINPDPVCQNATAQLNDEDSVTVNPAIIDNGSSDNTGTVTSGALTLSLDEDTFDCSNLGQNTVTLTVEDGSGNTAECTATVTVEDVTPPTARCKTMTIELPSSGRIDLMADDVDDGSSDTCDDDVVATLNLSRISLTGDNLGENTVTLTVMDDSNNQATCEAKVTLEDKIAPIARCRDVTVELDALSGSVSIIAVGGDDANYNSAYNVNDDSDDNSEEMFFSLSKATFGCSDVGQNTVTLTVTDPVGNASTCQATVTVEDNIDPEPLCKEATLPLGADGTATLTADLVDNGSSDACGNVTLEVSPSRFTNEDLGEHTVTLTVTDEDMNSATCPIRVTVVDETPAIARCKDITVQLDAMDGAAITTADVDNGSTDNDGIASLSLDRTNFGCSDVGENTVTLTVTDNSDNMANCTATVKVEDVTPPIAVCGVATLELGSDGTVALDAAAVDNGSSDTCGNVTLTVSPNSFTATELGTNTVTLTVTDNSGNEEDCTATVTVEDNLAPTAFCQDTTVELDTEGSATIAVADVDNGSSDNSGTTVSLSLDRTSFNCSNVGENTVTLTVTDDSGNTASCNAAVTVTSPLRAIVTNNGPICQDSPLQLNETSGLGTSWSWTSNGNAVFNDPDIQNPEVTGVSDGEEFTVTITQANGCTAAGTTVAFVLEPPVLEVAEEQGFCASENPTVSDLEIPGSGTVRWYPDASSSMELVSETSLVEGGIYYGSLEDANGCISNQRVPVKVTVANCGRLEDLNRRGFSPDGDGINDTFSVSWLRSEYPKYTMTIYDRNGSLVYWGDVSTPDWDGSATRSITLGDGKLPNGVYYYTIDFGDGTTPSFQGIIYLNR
ncbi:BspA family leucine-rich repeat surface protein [Muricauda sp. SCSIO 64092]|uniref:BspA family leucine-rich repeat surface protein n=1 Tax=Allomuricauda sp. SCSIO 64092 TaxID=2908842 RepID=UPI001FF4DEC5|nr:BspA family leucine-rich repeat surface protein [Muricauda sp. SCSIO 64092]UOY05313.1 BspA family leucine-rich repeat surface protein [Muricauda sp. SCSIO 64092]